LILLCISLALALITPHLNDPTRYETLRGCETNLPVPPDKAEMHYEIRNKFLTVFSTYASGRSVIFLEGMIESDRHSVDVMRLPFRQFSNFLYLTGANEPDFNFALTYPEGKSVLFIPKRDEYWALWNGVVETPEEIQAKYGVDHVKYNEDIETEMDKLTDGKVHPVYMINGQQFRGMEKFKLNTGVLANVLTTSRIVKTDKELDLLRSAFKISTDAHIKLMKDCEPGLMEYNLESFFMYYSMSCGARFQSYLPIVGSGNRSAILHYNANNKLVEYGEFVLVDAGSEYIGYASDITRTYPANGRFSEDQKLIYEMVLHVQDKIIKMLAPGVLWSTLAVEASRSVCHELKNGGFLQGEVEAMYRAGVCGLFYPHGLGHYLGLDVHDASVSPGLLGANMALTVEPGIYFNRAFVETGMNNQNQRQYLVIDKINDFLDKNIGGVRIEDDIIITNDGHEVLSTVPKTVKGIEELMNQL